MNTEWCARVCVLRKENAQNFHHKENVKAEYICGNFCGGKAIVVVMVMALATVVIDFARKTRRKQANVGSVDDQK